MVASVGGSRAKQLMPFNFRAWRYYFWINIPPSPACIDFPPVQSNFQSSFNLAASCWCWETQLFVMIIMAEYIRGTSRTIFDNFCFWDDKKIFICVVRQIRLWSWVFLSLRRSLFLLLLTLFYVAGWGVEWKVKKNMKTRRLAVLRALLERGKLSRGNS